MGVPFPSGVGVPFPSGVGVPFPSGVGVPFPPGGGLPVPVVLGLVVMPWGGFVDVPELGTAPTSGVEVVAPFEGSVVVAVPPCELPPVIIGTTVPLLEVVVSEAIVTVLLPTDVGEVDEVLVVDCVWPAEDAPVLEDLTEVEPVEVVLVEDCTDGVLEEELERD
jgi:hypothetical protein